jgi:hypothetical protein
MKTFDSDESCIGVDRLATCDEVRYAIAFLSQKASLDGCTPDAYSWGSDFASCVRFYPKKLTWSSFVSKKHDSKTD